MKKELLTLGTATYTQKAVQSWKVNNVLKRVKS